MPESTSPRLVDLSISQFAAKLASAEAAPGGGSAAALAGALAAGLVAMVARLTVGRERYAAVEDSMQQALEQSDRLQAQLLALVDADALAYLNVMKAYALPKESDEEKAERRAAIQEALKHATHIPLAIAEASIQVLNLAVVAARYGNRNAASDGEVAGLLAKAALEGAIRNLRINLESVRDASFRAAAEARLAGLVAKAEDTLLEATAPA